MATRRELFKKIRTHAWVLNCAVTGPRILRQLTDEQLERLASVLEQQEWRLELVDALHHP